MGGLFLARNQDLPGCKAQKTTIGEVITNVDAAHVDYIQALLASCLPVSEP